MFIKAQITRLIYAAAGEKFDDHRLEYVDWAASTEKHESPIGQAPYLVVGDVKLTQSMAIARYVAREFGLAGKDNLEQFR